jgi:hypothetical protein
MEMIKHNRGSFKENKGTLTVYDGHGNIILKGVNQGDDLWSCEERDLRRRLVHAYPSDAMPETDLENEDQHTVYELDNGQVGPDDGPLVTAEERKRAKEVYNLCARLRHPGDHSMIMALDGGAFSNNHLTAQDFRNGRRLYGPCPACTEGKMKAPREPASLTEPARFVGEHLHIDLVLLKSISIGQNTVIVVAVDDKSNYIAAVPAKRKTSAHMLEAVTEIVLEFNRFGHKVSRITTDDEHTLATLRSPLAKIGITVNPTPAGLHEKKIERYIQTVKDRKRSILAGLSYELPANLECEAYLDAITWINRMPNTNVGASTTPYQLVTRQRSFLPHHHFGQVGLFYSGYKDQRAE